MNHQLITRNLTFLPRSGDGASIQRKLFISIGPIRLAERPSPVGSYECTVTTGPSPLIPTVVSGRDPIGTLITALGAVEGHCQMLNVLGELRLEDGTPYDPELDGLKIIEKRIWASGFRPPFLDVIGGNSSG
ncbi:hypothetical protein [Duganella qianjiadongensis]|uniref:Uncharacterized protein n=1 Tax=Duganella qianjiadongensis TaxID=2692176 RepID=A0ABW9VSV5_9BURK|nr:hypothetical protein [Duganella qianjiadongensis]MYM42165.1 hypothetical protein [Duganella qianjiadongensis]